MQTASDVKTKQMSKETTKALVSFPSADQPNLQDKSHTIHLMIRHGNCALVTGFVGCVQQKTIAQKCKPMAECARMHSGKINSVQRKPHAREALYGNTMGTKETTL